MKTHYITKTLRITPVLFLLFIYSCGSDSTTNTTPTPVDSAAFTYPLTNGSTWNYTHNITFSNFRPDSIRHYFSQYPVNGTGTVTILYDTVINGITTKCFLETYLENGSTFKNRSYFYNTDTSLIDYAHRPESGIYEFIPFGKERHVYLNTGGKRFGSVGEMIMFLEHGIPENVNNDTLIIYNPPVISLKYPERTGTEWIAYYAGSTPYISKKYSGFVNITINNTAISCVKVQRTNLFMSGITLTDYVSKYGVTKKELSSLNQQVTNEFGVLIGYVDMYEYEQLNSYNIVNP